MARHKIRQAEVDDLDVPTLVQEQIFDLEISVNQAVSMEVLKENLYKALEF